MQLADLRRMAEARGARIVEEYVDRGVSGTKDRRPALDALMKAAQRRRFDAVWVWRFDRFARSLRHLVSALDEFRALGIDFLSHQEAVDTSTPAGRMLFQVIGAMAEFEREIIRERVLAGIRRARKNGRRLGRPRVQVDAGRARALRSEGLSYRDIAARLRVSVGKVYGALNPVTG
jgi:DNA invertase Pin-like site-specific DNA recombinase